MRKFASSLALAVVVLGVGTTPAHAQDDYDDGIIRVPTLISLPVLENITDALT